MTDADAMRFGVGDVIGSSITVLRRDFVLLAVTALVVAGLPALLHDQILRPNLGSDPRAVQLLYSLFESVLQLGAQAALMTHAFATLTRSRVDLRVMIGRGLTAALPLFGLTLVQGLITVAGLLALVVPGLLLLAMWPVAMPSLVIERLSISMAFRRSSALTKGRRWAALGLALIYIVLVVILTLAASTVDLAQGCGVLPAALAGALSATLIFMLTTAGVSALYFELRATEINPAPSTIIETFA